MTIPVSPKTQARRVEITHAPGGSRTITGSTVKQGEAAAGSRRRLNIRPVRPAPAATASGLAPAWPAENDAGRYTMAVNGTRTEQMDPVDVAWLHMDRRTNLMVVNTVLWFDVPVDQASVLEMFGERVVAGSVGSGSVSRTRRHAAPWAAPEWVATLASRWRTT